MTEIIIDSYSETNQNGSGNLGSTYGTTRYGQSFHGSGAPLSTCKFYLKRHNSASGNIVAYLYSHTGTYGTTSEPNTLLATSNTVDVSTIPTNATLITFVFPAPYSTVLGTSYVIVVEYTGIDGINVYWQTSKPGGLGNQSAYSGGWTHDRNIALCFYTIWDLADVSINLALTSKKQTVNINAEAYIPISLALTGKKQTVSISAETYLPISLALASKKQTVVIQGTNTPPQFLISLALASKKQIINLAGSSWIARDYTKDEQPKNLNPITADKPVGNDLFMIEHNRKVRSFKKSELSKIVIVEESQVNNLTDDLNQKIRGVKLGDWSDGDLILESDRSLTKDMYCRNVVVPKGINLFPNGHSIYFDTFTLDGNIKCDGFDGGNGGFGQQQETINEGISGGSRPTGCLPYGLAGLDGGRGGAVNGYNGKTGSTVNNVLLPNTFKGGKGGKGGDCSSGNPAGIGGTEGQGSPVNTINDKVDLIFGILGRLFTPDGIITPNISGINGSGSGGGCAGNPAILGTQCTGSGGGASGSNGGMITLVGRVLRGSGTIKTNGGKGGRGGDGFFGGVYLNISGGGAGPGGGAAGGNAGIVFMFIVDMSGFTGAILAIGGDGGDGGKSNNASTAPYWDGGFGFPDYQKAGFAGAGAQGGGGGEGGSGGIIIVITCLLGTSFTYSVNFGNGGNGGNGGDGGIGRGGSYISDPEGFLISLQGVNGNGGYGGDGADGFKGGAKGKKGISPPEIPGPTGSIHTVDGEDGLDGISNGLKGIFSLVQI
jgi:hypothetical protein